MSPAQSAKQVAPEPLMRASRVSGSSERVSSTSPMAGCREMAAACRSLRQTLRKAATSVACPWPYPEAKVYDPNGFYEEDGQAGPYFAGIWYDAAWRRPTRPSSSWSG